jgi:hypothetical protein
VKRDREKGSDAMWILAEHDLERDEASGRARLTAATTT